MTYLAMPPEFNTRNCVIYFGELVESFYNRNLYTRWECQEGLNY